MIVKVAIFPALLFCFLCSFEGYASEADKPFLPVAEVTEEDITYRALSKKDLEEGLRYTATIDKRAGSLHFRIEMTKDLNIEMGLNTLMDVPGFSAWKTKDLDVQTLAGLNTTSDWQKAVLEARREERRDFVKIVKGITLVHSVKIWDYNPRFWNMLVDIAAARPKNERVSPVFRITFEPTLYLRFNDDAVDIGWTFTGDGLTVDFTARDVLDFRAMKERENKSNPVDAPSHTFKGDSPHAALFFPETDAQRESVDLKKQHFRLNALERGLREFMQYREDAFMPVEKQWFRPTRGKKNTDDELDTHGKALLDRLRRVIERPESKTVDE